MSFTLGDGKFAGFHVELCQRALADIQKQLGMSKLDIKYQPVTSQNPHSLVQNGTVDIECGSTTNNAARQKDVSFAATTYVEGGAHRRQGQFTGIASIAQLNGRNVATTTGTTSCSICAAPARSWGGLQGGLWQGSPDSFLLLESGRADAFVRLRSMAEFNPGGWCGPFPVSVAA
ncbi:MAG: transporter substrate-binding domain-containing protein [Rhodocyclaceae bacterium]|nr:transporter substrate-binding domain-containing protein [Rhodocyclaceae bacterium]